MIKGKEKWTERFLKQYQSSSLLKKNATKKRSTIAAYFFAILALALSFVWVYIQVGFVQLLQIIKNDSCGNGEGSCGWGVMSLVYMTIIVLIPYIVSLIGLYIEYSKLHKINKLQTILKILTWMVFGYAAILLVFVVIFIVLSVYWSQR